jgi:hypothetical protein
VPLTVSFKVSGSATAGADYANPGESVTLIPNSPFGMVTIKPVADAVAEGNETVVLSLVEKKGAYTLGEDKTATATIADSAGASGAKPGTVPPVTVDPARDAMSKLPPPDRTGSLLVEVSIDGAGKWSNPKNGAYSNLKFHRVMTYTMPVGGTYSAGSGFTDIDRREQKGAVFTPSFKRYLILQPRERMGSVQRPCARGRTEFFDEFTGKEVGDPGQPPLVPFVQTFKGGGAFPSGDKTVPERDLCETMMTLDYQKHVFYLRIDGSDAFVKVHSVHNGLEPGPPYNLQLQGNAAGAKAKLTFFDVPMAADAKVVEGSRVIENFSQMGGPDHSVFPLRATVKWKLTVQ